MSPLIAFLLDLTAKMALTATIVVIISVVVERSGPFVGALIAALPTAAGAAYIILAFEHPPDFIAASAVGSAAATAAVSIFAYTYSVLAQRHGLLLSMSVAIAIWFVAAAVLRIVAWTPLTAALLNIGVFGMTVPLSWRYRTSGLPAKFLRSAYDIPLRALTAAIVVAAVTTASYSIGSFLSGVFAVFPIVMGCSAVILASARRRHCIGEHVCACANRTERALARISHDALSGGTARRVGRIRARADGVRLLERAALPHSDARYESPFASCALST